MTLICKKTNLKSKNKISEKKKIHFKQRMSNRKPIPIENIGGKMELLPRDIREIIEPMALREYLRIRKLAENIIENVILKIINSNIMDYTKAIDVLTDYLILTLGLNLSEYIKIHFPNLYSMFENNFFQNLLGLFISLDTIPINARDELWDYVNNSEQYIFDYIITIFNEAGYLGSDVEQVIADFISKSK